jgi:hypothetical protein
MSVVIKQLQVLNSEMDIGAAITQIRNAGIHVPLVIDGTNWGQNINILQSQGPGLIEFDPDSNLIFSVHMWWPQMYGYDEEDIVTELQQSVDLNLPLIVGEFSQMHGQCDTDEITEENSIEYLTILEQCHIQVIGWIAWSWFGNCNPFWDMTTDGTYATLYDWGLEVAVTDDYSIANTHDYPYTITGIGDRKDIVRPDGFKLKQNYPNPFNASTKIVYQLYLPANITLDVYDIKGQKIKSLVNEWKSSGNFTVQWNGLNDAGKAVASGIYLYQITARHKNSIFKQTNKLMLLK